jgi:hypothetical protein
MRFACCCASQQATFQLPPELLNGVVDGFEPQNGILQFGKQAPFKEILPLFQTIRASTTIEVLRVPVRW